MFIKDPNTSQGARVTADSEGTGRLLVQASEEPSQTVAAVSGRSYTFFHAAAFTTANESGQIYIKNNSPEDLVLYRYQWFIGNSVGGSGSQTVRFFSNPTGGTLITGANPISKISNNNFGLVGAETFTGDAYGGDGTALTVTPAPGLPFEIQDNQPIVTFDASTILPQGTSIAFTWQAPAGNTAQLVTMSIQGYYRDTI